jgi:hypothetical protein
VQSCQADLCVHTSAGPSQPGTVATLLCTYILPLQPTLLCAAAALLAFLGPLPRTCAAECRSEAQVAAALYVGGCP